MNTQLTELRRLLAAHFDKNDLGNLFFDLAIDREEAAGSSKSELIRYLLETCQQRAQLPQLITLCRQQRPFVEWPEMTRLYL